MGLPSGTKLGPYEIQSPLGAGGMGEVYRARDTRLGRDVAIKVLPKHLSSDPDLKARLEREAKAISSLSHPYICALFDVGDSDGTEFLVLELLEGESLAGRLQRGPLTLEQTLAYGLQIADALEYAHRRGVIHRDLKPGNVVITKTGLKLLDFGLAKPAVAAASSSAFSAMTASHHSKPLTAEGTLVGTFQYMAPEQLEGREADVRSDIFAFGCVLYEMAAGRRAFDGKTQASIVASILAAEPPAISSVQPLTPPSFERTVKLCLAKDPDERWQTAHDVKLQLKWIIEGGSDAGIPKPVAARRRRHESVAWSAAAILLLIAAVASFFWWHYASTPQPVWKSQLLPPADQAFDVPGLGGGHMAVSPDGRKIAFIASSSKGQQLWVQSLDQVSAQPLAGTEDGFYPFWSPDSRSIGFFVAGKMKKIAAAGGPVEIICDASSGRGGSWNSDGMIVFAPSPNSTLYVVSSAGGTPHSVTQLDSSRAEASHRWPFFLPDGRHFLFTARSFTTSNAAIFTGSLDSAERKPILDVNSNAIYVPAGYIVFVRDRSLMAQRFNTKRLEPEGDPVPLAEKVAYELNFSKADFSLSANGILAYKQGSSGSADSQLSWYDRSGKKLSDITTTGAADFPSLSPDAKVLAFGSFDQNGWTLWLQDLIRNVKTRFSFSPGSLTSVWSPDGKQIVFAVSSGATSQLFIKPADGSRPEQPLAIEGVSTSFVRVPLAWSPDGRYLLYREGKTGLPEIWALPMTGERKPFPVAQVPSYHLLWADFSPDGKWLTYQSDESGRSQVYAVPFPGPGSRWQVSSDGGVQPLWRGNDIFFWNAGQLWTAEVHALGGGLQLGTPRALFSLPNAGTMGQLRHTYDVTRDGKRFVIGTGAQIQTNAPLSLVVNWPEELRK